ncbi:MULTISPECIES: GH25 family lysozyme [unclassified Sphingomonas]|uniref:GH25 family lysozyme n=1 Tax=unclassified Sphingomonas TaxID=196159 RepID=UPI00226A27E2
MADRYSLARVAVLLAVIGIAGIAAWSWATHWAPAPARYPFQGIDLPEDAPPVEWGSVKANGAAFAYIVATSGADRRDSAFEANWAAIGEAGMRRGAVHVYSLCQPAAPQANAFNTLVARDDEALPAAVDIAFHDDCAARPAREALVADLARFATMVEAHTRKPILLRIAKPVESAYALSETLHRPVWVVGDFLSPGYAARPWAMWRANDVRRIEGVEGPVNWDVVAP